MFELRIFQIKKYIFNIYILKNVDHALRSILILTIENYIKIELSYHLLFKILAKI